MVRFDQEKITFEDSNNVDQYEVELVNGDELKVTHLPTGNSWKFDDDSDGTLTANTLEAGGWSFIGEFDTLSDFDAAASSGDRGYITEEQQFARQP